MKAFASSIRPPLVGCWLAGWLAGGWLVAGYIKEKTVASLVWSKQLHFPRNAQHGSRHSTKGRNTQNNKLVQRSQCKGVFCLIGAR